LIDRSGWTTSNSKSRKCSQEVEMAQMFLCKRHKQKTHRDRIILLSTNGHIQMLQWKWP
jgi:Ulp1 family protease